MSTRNSKKAIIKRIKRMPDAFFHGVQQGVNEDIKNDVYPEDTMLTACWTNDEVKGVGDFDCDFDIMHELIGCCIARTLRQIVLEENPEVLNDIQFTVKLCAMTDPIQDRIAKYFVSARQVATHDVKIDEAAKQKLMEKRLQFVQAEMGQFQA